MHKKFHFKSVFRQNAQKAQVAPVTPLLQSFVPYAVAPEEQDHYDDVHDEEHGDDEIAEVAVKIY